MRNRYEIRGDVTVLFAKSSDGQTHEVLIDTEDLEKVSGQSWQVDGGYVRSGGTGDRLHRIVMNAPQGLDVDHIHHNKLDNRKSEMRLATRRVNCVNRKSARNVHFQRASGKWVVIFALNYKNQSFGSYATKDEAERVASDLRARFKAGEEVEGFKRPPISGVAGINWSKADQLWQVRPTVDGKRVFLGCFRDKADAIACLENYRQPVA